jgi:sporulation protein YlmC with PRC-barrel domain
MQKTISNLTGNSIVATDGDIGTLEDFYFDDLSWTIRYLLAGTGDYFVGKDVLLSPFSIEKVDSSGRINVMSTRRQVDASPTIDIEKPVSSQHESSYNDFYGYPHYWRGPNLWGPTSRPQLTAAADDQMIGKPHAKREEPGELHLRSAIRMIGYHTEATDGEIGRVEDFVIDEETWEIRYLVVDTCNWLPGKKVIISPRWIEHVNWANSTVYVNLCREAIKSGPEYRPDALNRQYEGELYDHYDRPKYWHVPLI